MREKVCSCVYCYHLTIMNIIIQKYIGEKYKLLVIPFIYT